MKKTKTAPKREIAYYGRLEKKNGEAERTFIKVEILGERNNGGSLQVLIKLPGGELREVWEIDLYRNEVWTN
jgi:hypothetical protein